MDYVLSAENENVWQGIPNLDRKSKYYFFSCNNSDEVIYKGKDANYTQYGPYIYDEKQEYQNVAYGVKQSVPGLSNQFFNSNVEGAQTADGLTADHLQSLEYSANNSN